MPINETNEKRFESDIEASFLSPSGGYVKGCDAYDPSLGLYVHTLIDFIQRTQPKEWARFENANQMDTVRKFCVAFNNACDMFGLVHVLRHGFKHRGITFRVCYFRPESSLNQTAAAQYAANHIAVYRQWYYSADNNKSVDMVLVLNGIPVFAFELKNQYTGQNADNAKLQWMYDRDPREICFQLPWTIRKYGWRRSWQGKTPTSCPSTRGATAPAGMAEREIRRIRKDIRRHTFGKTCSKRTA